MKSRSEAKAEAEAAAKKGKVTPAPPESESVLDAKNLPENPFEFESANASKKTKVRTDLEKIVTKVFVVDLHDQWLKLREALTVGEKRSEHGVLNKALDEAEKNAHMAHRVYITAKIERERWERENDTIWGAMWSEANKSLQKEKEEGTRAKQLTDADIKARVATLHPEEYQEIEVRRAKIKATVDSLEDLAVQWKSRCKSLQTMKGTLRG